MVNTVQSKNNEDQRRFTIYWQLVAAAAGLSNYLLTLCLKDSYGAEKKDHTN